MGVTVGMLPTLLYSPALKAVTLWLVGWTFLSFLSGAPGEHSLSCPSLLTYFSWAPAATPLVCLCSQAQPGGGAGAGLPSWSLSTMSAALRGLGHGSSEPPIPETGGPVPTCLPIPPARPTVTLVPYCPWAACLSSLWGFFSRRLRVSVAALATGHPSPHQRWHSRARDSPFGLWQECLGPLLTDGLVWGPHGLLQIIRQI